MKKTNKFLAGALIAFAGMANINAQNAYECPCCPPIEDREVVLMSSLADANGNLTQNHTLLTCDKLYILDRKIYVNNSDVTPGNHNGDTLTILPGVVIQAQYAGAVNATALIVTRGSKIFANGSECCPIVFTSVNDPLDGTYPLSTIEQWGGIIILGWATNTVAAGELIEENPFFVAGGPTNGMGCIEGVDATDRRHWYGMESGAPFQDDDNSGVMKYVSIRHGGSELGSTNEINGLTLGSVGNGTTLKFIEVIANKDDGIEFFGGSVNLKYAKVLYCGDDYIDYDQGYNGKIQFVLGVQRPTTAPGAVARGDNGFECDGDDGDDYPRLRLSDPTISNATIIGNDLGTGSGDVALELKERTLGDFYNSIFSCFHTSINVPAPATTGDPSVNYCTFLVPASGVQIAPAGAEVVTNNVDFVSSITGFSACGWTTSYDAIPASGGTTFDVTTLDPFFDDVNYRGAYEVGGTPWWTCPENSTGTVNESVGYRNTDLNFDGITNAADLGIMIGNYNQ